jgi:hypothetical protein
MQSATQIGVLLVAASGGTATYFLTKRMLDENSSLVSTKPLAVCVAIICFFALVSTGPVILLPFAILGTLSLLLQILIFLRNRQIIPWPNPRRDSPPSPSHPTIPIVPPDSEQSHPEPQSHKKTPEQLPPVIPLIIQHPDGATRNRKKNQP